MKEDRQALREQYKALTGKNAFNGWSVEELKERIKKYSPEQAKELEKIRENPNYTKYKELPPPVVEHLEKTFGAWLNYMEVGMEWKKAFGGYAMYIKVPKEFSTEWRTQKIARYDNKTMRQAKDEEGNPVMVEVTTPDIRWKSLRDHAEAISWINLVKENILKKAYSAGLQLPNTNTKLDDTKQTLEEYKKATHA